MLSSKFGTCQLGSPMSEVAAASTGAAPGLDAQRVQVAVRAEEARIRMRWSELSRETCSVARTRVGDRRPLDAAGPARLLSRARARRLQSDGSDPGAPDWQHAARAASAMARRAATAEEAHGRGARRADGGRRFAAGHESPSRGSPQGSQGPRPAAVSWSPIGVPLEGATVHLPGRRGPAQGCRRAPAIAGTPPAPRSPGVGAATARAL